MPRLCSNWLLSLVVSTVGSLVLQAPAATAIPLAPGELVVSGGGFGHPSSMTRIDPTTGAQSPIVAGSFVDFALADRETIYAIEGGAVVRVDVATGSKVTISSGGEFINPAGITVDRTGQIYVHDLGNEIAFPIWDGSIIRVDPVTGSQTVLSSGGLLTAFSWVDLEMGAAGDLIVLDLVGRQSEVVSVNVATGQQTLLYSDFTDSPNYPSEFLYTGTGLGIAPNGDIYVSNGTSHSGGVLKIDAITGEPEAAGLNLGCCWTDSSGVLRWNELFDTDMAFGDDGSGWMVGQGRSGGPDGLWRWDFAALFEDGEMPFAEGIFNEVQVVSGTLPIPEPSTVLLLGLGLIGIAMRSHYQSGHR